eukprot:gnl/MRDRNA2_/MRDRNA2_69228_c0_seq2.p1 gnl/MRDRNA2_/MRDRNA2_69228_c0~~gnl/MRDRNA2_/MRDRNA2_69228_c0_seq2.p1  ORF type:complete len:123 (-),score=25.93 gnl/MRDRNA2_/MRDRNA2_69228_c0_seq2:129-497(-)
MLGFHDTPGDVSMRDVKFLQEIPPRGTCHLEQIALAEKARGKGLGKKLLIWAENKAQDRDCKRMRLEVISSNKHAIGVYKKQGYVALKCTFKQCYMCPVLCCLMNVPYALTMEKQLEAGATA